MYQPCEMGGRIGQGYSFQTNGVSFIRKGLPEWFGENKRDMPWRNAALTQDRQQHAYAVWVSEIMLQQTRVATVIDYYKRWMKRWPTVDDLSKATLEQVNEVWSGLGYYSRARRLLEGATKVVTKLAGKIPENADKLMKEIPGVGRYTAAAIASIAFGEPVGVVDGNVIRVICRLLTIGGDTSAKSVIDFIWKEVNRLVPEENPGDFNQALMELGAMVCTPTSPSCDNCPLRTVCRAYAEAEEYKSNSSVINYKNDPKKRKSSDGYKGATKKQKQDNNEDITEVDLEKQNEKSSGGHESSAKTQKSNANDSANELDIESCADFLALPKDRPWVPALGVTNYPRKAKKKPPRHETALISAIEWRDGEEDRIVKKELDDSAIKCLLTQRPQTGLLAGLWEFPTVTLTNEDMSHTTFKKCFTKKAVQPSKASSKYVAKLTDQNLRKHLIHYNITHREHIGEYTHIFSHIHLRYIVEHVVVTGKGPYEKEREIVRVKSEPLECERESLEWKWVNKDCLGENAVSSAMNKIMKLCDNRKKTPKNGNQAKLTKFFAPKREQTVLK